MSYGLHSAASDAALRGLFDRLRDHVAQTEERADDVLERLEGALAKDPAAAPALLAEPRAGAAGMARLAAELAELGPDREALRRLSVEFADRAARLDRRLAEAQAQVDRAVANLAGRLDRWDALAADRDRRFAATVADRLEAAEQRQTAELSDFLATLDPLRPGVDPQVSPAPTPRRRATRSTALLLSAGVACLGLTTLAVVLEPPFAGGSPGEPQPARVDVTVRGQIFIAPPRMAAAEEFAPPAGRGGLAAAEAQKQVAAAIASLEQGRPGALSRLRALADAGATRAQLYLAKMYETGTGVEADSAEARRWTTRAAEAGDAIGLHNLALYYLEGRGGPRDDAVAARLFRRSSAAGVADSQFNLGLLYEAGAGVDRNLVEAYRWYQIAANGGDLKARERAVALEPRLSAAEMAGAQRMAATFRPGAADEQETLVAPGASTVAESQRKLARLGYYIGPTDGRDTPAYRQALDAYNRSSQAQAPASASAGQP